MFFDILTHSIETGTPLDPDAIDKEMAAFEWQWTDRQQTFSNIPEGDVLELVKEIHQKYQPLFHISNE